MSIPETNGATDANAFDPRDLSNSAGQEAGGELQTYSLFLVFAEPELIENRAFADEAVRNIEQLDSVIADFTESEIEFRGAYDITGFNAVGSVLAWLRSTDIGSLQWAKRQFERTLMFCDTAVVESLILAEVGPVAAEPLSWVSVVEATADVAETDDEDFAELLEARHDAEAASGSALATSFHVMVGAGEMDIFAVVETDDPRLLVGETVEMLEAGFTSSGEARTGRRVGTAELYEILR